MIQLPVDEYERLTRDYEAIVAKMIRYQTQLRAYPGILDDRKLIEWERQVRGMFEEA